MAEPVAEPPRASLVAWRALVAVSGLGGFALADREFERPLEALSQQASLFAGLVFAGLAVLALVRPGMAATWLRGATAALLALVGLGYLLLLSPDYGPLYSLLEHAVTPLLVIADVLLVQRRPARWWWPLGWALLPIAYLVYYLMAGLDLYAFLDTSDPGFGATLATLFAGFFVVAFAMVALTRIGRRRRAAVL